MNRVFAGDFSHSIYDGDCIGFDVIGRLLTDLRG